MSNDSAPAVPGYSDIRKLGEGPSGWVYRAWDQANRRYVVVKWLRREVVDVSSFRNRCLSSLEGLRGTTHPNVGTLYNVHTPDDPRAIIREYVEGCALGELIARGPLDNEDALSIVVQISDALEFAHHRQVVHGNLRPSNVLVTRDKVVKLTDFGLWCYPDVDEALGRQSAVGALAYVSPQHVTRKPVTPQSDFFSLGCILYELLTGEPLFGGDTPGRVTEQILNSILDVHRLVAAGIPGDTILIIEKLLAGDPLEQFSSAHELSVTLRAVAAFERRSALSGFLNIKPETPRQYLMISLLTVLLVVLWIVLASYRG